LKNAHAIVAVSALILPAIAQAGPIALNPSGGFSKTSARAADSSGGQTTLFLANTTIFGTAGPHAQTAVHTLSGIGTSSATNTHTYTQGPGNTASFNVSMNHARTGSYRSFASSFGDLYFTAVTDATFTLSGTYTVTSGQELSSADIALYDTSTPSTLLSRDVSLYTAGAVHSFSYTGTLTAGTSYWLDWGFSINGVTRFNNPGAAYAPATAAGGFTLNVVGDNPIIPLPSAASMAMVGMGFAGARRRRH
jgi:hypothetical protein